MATKLRGTDQRLLAAEEVMSYPGNKNNRRLRQKYQDCDYVIVHGSTVRLLTESEIERFREHVDLTSQGNIRKRKPPLQEVSRGTF